MFLFVSMLGESIIFPREHLLNRPLARLLSGPYRQQHTHKCVFLTDFKKVFREATETLDKKNKNRMCSRCGGVSERGEVRRSCVGEGTDRGRPGATPKKPPVKKQTELVRMPS